MTLSKVGNFYVFKCGHYYKNMPRQAGFLWKKKYNTWVTKSDDAAYKLIDFASEELKKEIIAKREDKLRSFR
jgi:heme/copper-type cytochrome/quinol oxidase subunit 2